jgi:hypothetical protein
MYLKDCTLQEIKEATGLERVEVSRCIKRCLSRDENGSIYFQEEMTIKYHRYLIQALLNVVNPLFKFELPFTHRHIRSAPGLQNIRGFKMTFSNSLRMREWVSDEIYQLSLKTLNGISRYFRKTFFIRRSRIREFACQRMNWYNIQICPYAWSYVIWRQHVEGLEYYWEVAGFRPKRRYHYSPDFASLQDLELLEEIFERWRRESCEELSPKHIAAAKWIVNRTMAFMAKVHINHWLKNAENCIQSGTLFPRSPQYDDIDIPLFLLVLPNRKDHQ